MKILNIKMRCLFKLCHWVCHICVTCFHVIIFASKAFDVLINSMYFANYARLLAWEYVLVLVNAITMHIILNYVEVLKVFYINLIMNQLDVYAYYTVFCNLFNVNIKLSDVYAPRLHVKSNVVEAYMVINKKFMCQDYFKWHDRWPSRINDDAKCIEEL